jgi:hypothetical protein
VGQFLAGGKKYYIFGEVDNLSKAAQAGVKATLNSCREIFIITTNNARQLNMADPNIQHGAAKK